LLVSAIKLIVPLVMIVLLCRVLVPLAASAMPNIGGDGFFLPIPHHLILPSYNKSTSSSSSNNYSDSGTNKKQYMPKDATLGINIPKNLIVPKACSQNCTAIIGTQKDDIIIATAVTDATICGLGGNDIIQCGLGNCKAYGGSGDNVLVDKRPPVIPRGHLQRFLD
jgi:hypothetical protein